MPPKGRFALKKNREKNDEEEAPKERVLPRRERVVELPNAVCVLVENYFTIAECERYMAILQHEIDWKRQQVAVSRKEELPETVVAEPRLTLFMSDPGICYEYSGRENVGEGWHPAILEIKKRVEASLQECGQRACEFNSVQLNRYNGPRHALGMHADDEPDLLKGAPIVSVSFGCTREFRIQRRDNQGTPLTLELPDGSLLLMGGAMQSHYLHGVPTGAASQTGLRFNLTFRVCIPRAARSVAGNVHLQRGRGGKSSHAEAEASPELQQFILENNLDMRAADALLQSPSEVQRYVLRKGSLLVARNPSAALLSRLGEARLATLGAAAGAEPKASAAPLPAGRDAQRRWREDDGNGAGHGANAE